MNSDPEGVEAVDAVPSIISPSDSSHNSSKLPVDAYSAAKNDR